MSETAETVATPEADTDDRRAVIEAAFDAAEVPESVEPVKAKSEPAPAETKTEAPAGRDASGKFSKSTQPPVPSKAPDVAPATATPVADAPKAFKAPQSWKPTAREAWGTVPAAVQEEITRREREMTKTLADTAKQRQSWEQFQTMAAPYVGTIQAEGGNLMGTVGSLLQTFQALRTAPPAHKAGLVADIIQQFGIPIDILDQRLSGSAQPQQQPQQQFNPQQFAAQVRQQVLQDLTNQRYQANEQKALSELDSFSEDHEFLEEVRESMADLMEAAAKRGLQLDYESAYARACSLDPDISSVLEQRKAASNANANNASTQRAVRAASSVKSQPGTNIAGNEGPLSRRQEIEAAFSKLNGR